jgi:hypothetical protein
MSAKMKDIILPRGAYDMKKSVTTQLLCCALMAVYLLGVHDGKVALWSGDDPEPTRVFPYSVSLLPEDARTLLEQGIPINSMDDLNRLMEAYLS